MIRAYMLNDRYDLVKVYPGEGVDTVKNGMYLVTVPTKDLDVSEAVAGFTISRGVTKMIEGKPHQVPYIHPDAPMWLIMPYSPRRAIWPDEPSIIDARYRAFEIAKLFDAHLTAL